MIRHGAGLFLLVAVAAHAAAQQTPADQSKQPSRCRFESDRASADSTPGVGQVLFFAGHVVIRCPARGIVVHGDSAEQRPDGDHVIGHAIYDEPRFHVSADFLNYLSADERVIAVGNVNAKLPSGSTLVGPIAEYRRITPTRPHEQVIAKSRPTVNIVEKDSAGKPAPPMSVTGENIFMDGDSLIYAGGQVVITRPDITATADSVFLDQTKETMRLMRDPTLTGKKERPFTLTGDLIDLYSKNKKLQRVIARSNATATSDSMRLRSDTIDLRVTNDLLDHAYAWGRKSLARATSPSQDILADSIDVTMPGQKVRLMRALGHAYAQGKPDTARFHVEKPDTTDWLRGDTITAHFDTLATKDTSKTPNIRQLLALGTAKSWYHMPASDSAERRPAINEVSARRITIDFDKQKVATVTAVDSVFGVYVEPRSDTAKTKPTATKAPAKVVPKPSTQPAPKIPPKTPPITPSTPMLNSSSPREQP